MEKLLSSDARNRAARAISSGLPNRLIGARCWSIFRNSALSSELLACASISGVPDYEMDEVNVYAVLPAGPRPSAKVRALVEFLAEELKRPRTS